MRHEVWVPLQIDQVVKHELGELDDVTVKVTKTVGDWISPDICSPFYRSANQQAVTA